MARNAAILVTPAAVNVELRQTCLATAARMISLDETGPWQ
jgi:hypothetical protein